MLFTPTIWIFLLATAVILMLAAVIVAFSGKGKSEQRERLPAAQRKWEVQCPQCGRWKEMAPRRTERLDPPAPSPQPGMQVAFANDYKCPFCGHRWREKYLE